MKREEKCIFGLIQQDIWKTLSYKNYLDYLHNLFADQCLRF